MRGIKKIAKLNKGNKRKMESIYTFRNDENKIQISFEIESEETEDNIRDNLAFEFLCKILEGKMFCYEELRDNFYQDDVQNIE